MDAGPTDGKISVKNVRINIKGNAKVEQASSSKSSEQDQPDSNATSAVKPSPNLKERTVTHWSFILSMATTRIGITIIKSQPILAVTRGTTTTDRATHKWVCPGAYFFFEKRSFFKKEVIFEVFGFDRPGLEAFYIVD